MRAKLERIAAGNIEFDKPVVTLSDSVITLSGRPGEKTEGSFTLTADRPVKGVVYASSSRMSLERTGFHSRAVRVGFSFDARGFWGGEEIEGEFCIVTEAGEFLLPYTVRVEAHQEPEKEHYAYFISADPIEPLPEKENTEKTAQVQTVVEITENTEEDLNPEEAVKLAKQILADVCLTDAAFERLERLYYKSGSKELLSDICSHLIRNGRTDEKSFLWYRRGVQAELKITRLYEYFMKAVPEKYGEAFPKNLLLYFQLENTLNSAQKAALYANIIRFWKEDSEIFRRYREQIESFMLDELIRRHLSEDLAVIYDQFLVEELLTIDFAEALADIMFLRKIQCQDRRIRQVQVLYEQLQKRIVVPLSGGQAMIPVYTPGAVILLTDEQGNCYSSSVPYTLKKMMNEQRYASRCRELLRYHQGLYLYLCDGTSRYHVLTPENVENYKRVLKINGFTAQYKENVRQELLQFYYANHELDDLDQEFFVSETASMNPKDRARYTEILILRGMYEEAWSMIWRHGYTMVRSKFLIKLAAWKIREREYEEDEFLLHLCLFIFQNHKYNESILEYLSGYYCGSAETMETVWRAAREFELNVFELEERLLGQMLFTGQIRDSAFEIFRDYHSLGGEGLVSRAYLTWLAFEDFVRDHPAPEMAGDYMETAIAWEENLADICGLAYLRELAGRKHLNEHQKIRAEQMTEAYIQRKIRFGFMKPLLARLGKSWILEDKYFVEYRANPAHRVVLHYVLESPREKNCSYMAEQLYPLVPGVFVREFTLFYGERLTWFVTEIRDDGTEISTSDRSYVEEQEDMFATGTKYADIYEMSRALSERNLPKLERQMKEYGKKNFMVETLFSLK